MNDFYSKIEAANKKIKADLDSKLHEHPIPLRQFINLNTTNEVALDKLKNSFFMLNHPYWSLYYNAVKSDRKIAHMMNATNLVDSWAKLEDTLVTVPEDSQSMMIITLRKAPNENSSRILFYVPIREITEEDLEHQKEVVNKIIRESAIVKKLKKQIKKLKNINGSK